MPKRPRHSTPSRERLAFACGVALCAASAHAQLRLLDPTLGDVGPGSTSLREPRADLRQPAAFERVYALPGVHQSLVRFDSGIAAVFARSEYTQTSRGLIATIPAGTVFYIGKLPESLSKLAAPTTRSGLSAAAPAAFSAAAERAPSGSSAAASSAKKVDLRADKLPEVQALPASIWGSEGERSRRLDQLLGQGTTRP